MKSRAEAKIGEGGFTLLEILIVTILFSILLSILISFFLFSANIYEKCLEVLDLQQNVRIAADFIIRDLRYADTLQIISDQEIKYRLPGETALYTIKQKGEEIVILINKVENKIAYSIDNLVMSWDAYNKTLSFEIVGNENGSCFAVRSAVRLLNLR
ncbi:MAG TPA: prepilin-type N-terminal cleavage/methylation domain-containing protein [Firmicutes bacterium]|nr:prepilin-type N-terminal cleavage/methylation domain-containing protein [Bacillota bacterium]